MDVSPQLEATMIHNLYQALGTVASCALAGLVAVGAQETAIETHLSGIPTSREIVVLELTRDIGVRNPSERPRVRIYGDGRVVVHFPAYMKQAGDYQLMLSRHTLEELVNGAAQGMIAVASKAADEQLLMQRRLPTADGQKSGEVTRLDAAKTTIEIRLEGEQPQAVVKERSSRAIEGVPEHGDSLIRGTWATLRDNGADIVNESIALQKLARVERRLLQFFDDPNLERVAPD